MYYYIADGRVVETGDERTDNPEKEARALAEEFYCHVYVIQGQHSGITADPQDPRDAMTIDEIDQATEDTQVYMAELDKLARWNEMAQR